MIVYACQVYDCSEGWVESIHFTKRGAYFAGRKFLLAKVEEGYASRACIGKTSHDLMTYYNFKVVPMEILE